MRFFLAWILLSGWMACGPSTPSGDPPTPSPMPLSLHGRLLDPSGQPLPEISVTILESPATVPDLAAITSASGEFFLDELSPGRYLLRFYGTSGFVDREVLVGESNERIDFNW